MGVEAEGKKKISQTDKVNIRSYKTKEFTL